MTPSEEIGQLLDALHALQRDIAKVVGEIVMEHPGRAQDLVQGLQGLNSADYWLTCAKTGRGIA